MDAIFRLKFVMLLVWLGFIGFFYRELLKSIASRRWQKVPGQVLSCEVELRSTNRKNLYVPHVSYSYNLNGKQYQSQSFTFLGTSGGAGGSGFAWQVEERVEPFPPGSTVTVYVNPNDPSDAVLIPGVHWSQYAGLIFISLLCLGIGFIVEILNFIWPGCQPNCT